MKRFAWVIALMSGLSGRIAAQTSEQDAAFSELDTVVISFNQWEQKRNEVPNRILKVDLRDNILRNPQTAADMLGQSAGDCAGRQIGHSSRAEGHHDTDRFAGKVLRQGGLYRYGSQHERQGRAEERSTLHDGAKS